MSKYIGFDIGGTKCAVCIGEIGNQKLNILGRVEIPTIYSSPDEIIDKLMNELENLSGLKGIEVGKEYKYIGISCGGPLNEETGVLYSPPNLPKFDSYPIVQKIENRFGTKAKLLNDANACAVAEHLFGAGVGCKNMIFLTFGTGMGAGLILNNQLYSGTNSLAGECGHIRLAKEGPIGFNKRGSFEGYCSGGGIKQLGQIKAKELFEKNEKCSFCESLYELDKISAKSIAIKAKEGYQDALNVYAQSGKKLGQALSILIDLLNPQKIVIGSIFERSGELLKEEMYKVLKEECIEDSLKVCEIVPAKLNDHVGDYAAICAAIECENESIEK